MASVPGIAELNAIRAQVDAVGVMDIHPDASTRVADTVAASEASNNAAIAGTDGPR